MATRKAKHHKPNAREIAIVCRKVSALDGVITYGDVRALIAAADFFDDIADANDSPGDFRMANARTRRRR